MSNCRLCGFQNAPGTKFCTNCGSYQWNGEEEVHREDSSSSSSDPGSEAPEAAEQRPAIRIIAGRKGPSNGERAGAEGAGPKARARRIQESNVATTPVAVAISLATPELEVEPPDVASCEILVRNTGSLVDQFVLSVEGPASQWASVDPPILNLYPDDEPAVALVSFQPPRTSSTPAGPAAFWVRATSREDPLVSEAAAGRLDVRPYVDIATSIVPQTSEGKRGAEHDLTIRNLGNGLINVALAAGDPDRLLNFRIQPEVVQIPAGDYGMAMVAVAPRKRMWIGAPKPRSFFVDGMIEKGPGFRIDARHEQLPMIPPWAVRVAVLVLLPLAILLLYLLLTAKIPPVIGLTQVEAVQRLQDAGLQSNTLNVVSEEMPVGRVVTTEPLRNGRVRKGTDVLLSISAGLDPVRLPNLRGLDAGVARSQLLLAGLTARKDQEENESVGPGQVFATEPAAGGLAARGSQVVLKVVPGGSDPRDAGIVDFGPVDPGTGFPAWYQDSSAGGLRLELCLEGPPLCTNARDAFVGSAPDGEAHYWYAEAQTMTSPLNQGEIVFRSAVVAAFGVAAENGCEPRACAERTFSLIEIAAEAGTLIPGGIYKITHPFGTSTITANSSGGITREIGREEIGCFSNPPTECEWEVVQSGRVGPFLVWDHGAGAPPAGYVGDGTTFHTVTGSPTGNNLVRITGPELGDGLSSDQFLIVGKVSPSSTPPPGQAGVNPDPPSITVPSHRAGVASPPQLVTIRNHGDGSLRVSEIQVSGVDNEDWRLARQNCTGHTIPGGASCQISVTVTPSGDGPTNGQLTVMSNAFGAPHRIALSGAGQASQIEASPASLDLGSVPATVSTPPKTVSIKNAGTTDLVVSRAEISGPNAGDFMITANACSARVPPGKDCTIRVAFKPTTGGERNAALSLTTDAPVPGTVQSIALTGTGQAPSSKISPPSMDVVPGTPGTVTLSSVGTTALVVKDIRIEGPNASTFSVAGSCAVGGSVAPGGSCVLSVAVNPALVEGLLSCIKGTLIVATDDPGSPEQRVNLVARPALPVSPC